MNESQLGLSQDFKKISEFKDAFNNVLEAFQTRSPGGICSYFNSREIDCEKFGLTGKMKSVLLDLSKRLSSSYLQHFVVTESKDQSKLRATFDHDFKSLAALQDYCFSNALEFDEDSLIFILQAVSLAGAALEDNLCYHPEISQAGVKIHLRESFQYPGNPLYSVRISNPLANDSFLKELMAKLTNIAASLAPRLLKIEELWDSEKREAFLSKQNEPELEHLRSAHEEAVKKSKIGFFRLCFLIAALASRTKLSSMEKLGTIGAYSDRAKEMLVNVNCSAGLKGLLERILLNKNVFTSPSFSDIRGVMISANPPQLSQEFFEIFRNPNFALGEDSALKIDITPDFIAVANLSPPILELTKSGNHLQNSEAIRESGQVQGWESQTSSQIEQSDIQVTQIQRSDIEASQPKPFSSFLKQSVTRPDIERKVSQEQYSYNFEYDAQGSPYSRTQITDRTPRAQETHDSNGIHETQENHITHDNKDVLFVSNGQAANYQIRNMENKSEENSSIAVSQSMSYSQGSQPPILNPIQNLSQSQASQPNQVSQDYHYAQPNQSSQSLQQSQTSQEIQQTRQNYPDENQHQNLQQVSDFHPNSSLNQSQTNYLQQSQNSQQYQPQTNQQTNSLHQSQNSQLMNNQTNQQINYLQQSQNSQQYPPQTNQQINSLNQSQNSQQMPTQTNQQIISLQQSQNSQQSHNQSSQPYQALGQSQNFQNLPTKVSQNNSLNQSETSQNSQTLKQLQTEHFQPNHSLYQSHNFQEYKNPQQESLHQSQVSHQNNFLNQSQTQISQPIDSLNQNQTPQPIYPSLNQLQSQVSEQESLGPRLRPSEPLSSQTNSQQYPTVQSYRPLDSIPEGTRRAESLSSSQFSSKAGQQISQNPTAFAKKSSSELEPSRLNEFSAPSPSESTHFIRAVPQSSATRIASRTDFDEYRSIRRSVRRESPRVHSRGVSDGPVISIGPTFKPYLASITKNPPVITTSSSTHVTSQPVSFPSSSTHLASQSANFPSSSTRIVSPPQPVASSFLPRYVSSEKQNFSNIGALSNTGGNFIGSFKPVVLEPRQAQPVNVLRSNPQTIPFSGTKVISSQTFEPSRRGHASEFASEYRSRSPIQKWDTISRSLSKNL